MFSFCFLCEAAYHHIFIILKFLKEFVLIIVRQIAYNNIIVKKLMRKAVCKLTERICKFYEKRF